MKKLTLENWKELYPYIKQADYGEYNSNIVTMLMWQSKYDIEFAIYPHFALVCSIMNKTHRVWFMPYCELRYRHEALNAMQEISAQGTIPFGIHSMTKAFKNWLMETYPLQFLIWDCYDAQDYVYDRLQQETLAGKKMQKRRNHFNAFLAQYEGRYRYKSIEQDDLTNIYAFLKEWQAAKELTEEIDTEETGIHQLLEHRDELPISGGCIYIDGKLEAFNITSQLTHDTIQIHVEKANRTIRGLYIAILKFYLETLPAHVQYVNREDDLGISALRKAKTDMHPMMKIHKYGSSFQPLQIRKATTQDTENIQKLWNERFQEESAQSSRYYFEQLYHEDECYVMVSEDELISMLQVRTMDIMLEGGVEQVAFIVGVATNEEYEGCSYMKQLMQHVLKELQTAYRFVYLQAYQCDLYKPFGFVEQYRLTKIKVDKRAYITAIGTLSSQYSIQDILHLYQQYTADKTGYRIRDEAYYKEMIAYKAIWNQQIQVHKTAQTMDAYVMFEELDDEIQISECVYTSFQALQDMLAILCQLDKKIYVTCDLQTSIEGRSKPFTTMMVKPLQQQPFPDTSPLYINEEL